MVLINQNQDFGSIVGFISSKGEILVYPAVIPEKPRKKLYD